MALWLAKKNELLENEEADYDLVLTGWVEHSEADILASRNPTTKFLAGLTHTWILDDPGWLEFLLAVANGGNPQGSLQITDDMYLMVDDNGNGTLDRKCSPPGWEDIYAMDPRHPGWRDLILSFYQNVAEEPQHDGVVIDMVDAYPFCEGGSSGSVQTPMDEATWVSAQSEILALIREKAPAGKWVFANAGHDFPEGSPFPQYLNGYLLENFLGSWGASLKEGLASAQRALETTQAPHLVVFAVDTDDTGKIDWARFRIGFVASLLMDNTYFAFDYGSKDHGGVRDWWFPKYYDIDLGNPLCTYTFEEGVYRRDFERGIVIIAAEKDARILLTSSYTDIVTNESGLEFVVPKGDARILLTVDGSEIPSNEPSFNRLSSTCTVRLKEQSGNVFNEGIADFVEVMGSTYLSFLLLG